MSHTHSVAPSSSKFQLIFNNALKVYEEHTKMDLLVHPLAAQLQTCRTPAAILAILQVQVQGLDQSQRGDERWSKWLDPTVNVLFAFSATIGTGVSLVFRGACYSSERDLRSYIHLTGIFSHECDFCWSWRSPFSEYLFQYPHVGPL